MGNSSRKGQPARCIPEMQRLSYDLSPLQELKVPIIWLVGPPGVGRDTQAEIIEENYGFDIIKIGELLRRHSSNETDRGRVIKENFDKNAHVIPNTIIMDLLKEEMLARTKWTTGFVLNGFPRNKQQALMFVDEVGPVDVIIILKCNMKLMIERTITKQETGTPADIKKKIREYNRNVNESIKGFSAKKEKFDTSKESADHIFPRIQSALNVRVFGDTATKNIIE